MDDIPTNDREDLEYFYEVNAKIQDMVERIDYDLVHLNEKRARLMSQRTRLVRIQKLAANDGSSSKKGPNPKTWECPVCGKMYSPQGSRQHMRAHEMRGEVPTSKEPPLPASLFPQ